MAVTNTGSPARARVEEFGAQIVANLGELIDRLLAGMLAEIPELDVDPVMADLLQGSIESNLDTVGQLLRYQVDPDTVEIPVGAREYARRLAQRGVPPHPLARAYRLGQQWVLDWGFDAISEREPDPAVAYAAMREVLALTFRYIDRITEQVLAEYETERLKWLSNQNTVRTQVLEQMLAGEPVELATAEATLGHRMRQQHLAAVIWSVDPDPSSDLLQELERLSGQLARGLGATGAPLFEPRDRTTAWAWFPLGHAGAQELAGELPDGTDRSIRVAIGTPGAGLAGFRATHLEALRAAAVAGVAGSSAHPLTSYGAAGVRAASLLVADVDGTRRLVADTLGPLAADDAAAARLRETLLVFLDENGSYVAAAERLHLHKNTVRYRVDRALEQCPARGEDRLSLRLALLACAWLGDAVLVEA